MTEDERGLVFYVLPFLAVTIGPAIGALWLLRRWSTLDLGRFGHAVRALVLLTLIACGAFLLVARAIGVWWLTYVLAFALATAASYRASR